MVNWNLQSYIIITYYLLLAHLAMRNIFNILKNFLKLLDNSHENNQRRKKVIFIIYYKRDTLPLLFYQLYFLGY